MVVVEMVVGVDVEVGVEMVVVEMWVGVWRDVGGGGSGDGGWGERGVSIGSPIDAPVVVGVALGGTPMAFLS